MAIRNFAAPVTKGAGVTTSTGSIAAIFTATDALVVDALAQTDIDASVAAEAAVAAIKASYDLALAQLNAQIYSSANPVTVVINGSLTQNQIRIALENVLANLDQSTEYARA